MKAVIELKVSELSNEIVDTIRSLFKERKDTKITISLEDEDGEYLKVLRRSKHDLENNHNLISFTMEELEEYGNSKKP